MKKTYLILLISITSFGLSAQTRVLDIDVYLSFYNYEKLDDGSSNDKTLTEGGGFAVNYYFHKKWSAGIGGSFFDEPLRLPMSDTDMSSFSEVKLKSNRLEAKIRRHLGITNSLSLIPYLGVDIWSYSAEEPNYYNVFTLHAGTRAEFYFLNRFGVFADLKLNDITNATDGYKISNSAVKNLPVEQAPYELNPLEWSFGVTVTLVRKKDL